MYITVFCFNMCDQVYSADLMSGVGGRCQLLGSLDTSMDVITGSAIWLTRGAMQGVKRTSEVST